jgi:hypothetical protein
MSEVNYSLITGVKMVDYIKKHIKVGESFQLPQIYSACAMRPHAPKNVDWNAVKDAQKILHTALDKYRAITPTMFTRIAD